MARRKDKEKVFLLRQKGASYSEIRQKLNVPKSTLSYWLRDYPLSPERIRELRDNNPQRIEKFRNTMRKKQEEKFKEAYKKVSRDIGRINKRELFIAGLFLYWAEGGKTANSQIYLGNTDPSMICFFIGWLNLLGIEKNNLKIRLQLYSDMDVKKETEFWSNTINISKKQFRKPYIKKSRQEDISYKIRYNHGTCNIIFGSKAMSDYVLAGIKKLQKLYGMDDVNSLQYAK